MILAFFVCSQPLYYFKQLFVYIFATYYIRFYFFLYFIYCSMDLVVDMKSNPTVVWSRTTKIIFSCCLTKNWRTLFTAVKLLSYPLQNMWRDIINPNGAQHFECCKVHKWSPVDDSDKRQSCDLAAWHFFGFSPQCAWSLLHDPKLDMPKKLLLAFESYPAFYKGSLDSWLVVLH